MASAPAANPPIVSPAYAPPPKKVSEGPACCNAQCCGYASRIILSVVLFVSLWVFWLVFLAGVGASQSSCSKLGGNVGGGNIPIVPAINLNGLGRRLQSSTCQVQFSYPFWLVFNQGIMIAAAMFLSAIPWLKQNFTTPIISWFTMQTALLMQLCGDLNTSINSLEGAKGDAGKLLQGQQAALAGALVLIILNFVYIFCAGSKLEALQLSFFPTPPAPTPVDANATNPNSKPYTQSNPVYNPPQAPGSPASVGTPTYQANPPMGSTVIVMAPASESPVMVRPPSSSGTLSLGPGAPPPVKAGGAGSSPPKMAD